LETSRKNIDGWEGGEGEGWVGGEKGSVVVGRGRIEGEASWGTGVRSLFHREWGKEELKKERGKKGQEESTRLKKNRKNPPQPFFGGKREEQLSKKSKKE